MGLVLMGIYTLVEATNCPIFQDRHLLISVLGEQDPELGHNNLAKVWMAASSTTEVKYNCYCVC